MLIAIQDYYFYAAIAFGVLGILGGVGIFYSIKNVVPEVMLLRDAAKSGEPVALVHFRGRKGKFYRPVEEKIEKEMGANFWKIPGLGLKFKPEPDDIEFIGAVQVIHYYESMTEPIKLHYAVALSNLRDYFAKVLKMPINGIEDIAFYVSSEYEKSDKQRALNNAKVESAETKDHINRYLAVVEKNKKEIQALTLKSGVFSWQTAMKALDSMLLFSSSHFANARETIRAAEKLKDAQERKEWVTMALVCVMLMIGLAALYVVIKQYS